MDLFGSVMFPDSSGDVVPMMYLRLLEDLESPSGYNWGGAVLAYLYHHLCHACEVNLYCHSFTIFSLNSLRYLEV